MTRAERIAAIRLDLDDPVETEWDLIADKATGHLRWCGEEIARLEKEAWHMSADLSRAQMRIDRLEGALQATLAEASLQFAEDTYPRIRVIVSDALGGGSDV